MWNKRPPPPQTVSLLVFQNKFSIRSFSGPALLFCFSGKSLHHLPTAWLRLSFLLWPVRSIVCHPPPSFLCAGERGQPSGFVSVPRPRQSASDQLRPVISQWKPQPFLSALISHYGRADRPARSWWRDAPIRNKRSGNCSWEYEPREEPICECLWILKQTQKQSSHHVKKTNRSHMLIRSLGFCWKITARSGSGSLVRLLWISTEGSWCLDGEQSKCCLLVLACL